MDFRSNDVMQPDEGWRYVGIVGSDVEYGSQNVRHDRPELQNFQNILMNGGVCGRRAFFGRFILRCFVIPTISRPSRGHAAPARWTSEGWVVLACLGPKWGRGSHLNALDRYPMGLDFVATSHARHNPDAFHVPTTASEKTGRPIGLPTEATGLIAGRQFAPGSREANNAGGRAGVPNWWPPTEHHPGMERPRP